VTFLKERTRARAGDQRFDKRLSTLVNQTVPTSPGLPLVVIGFPELATRASLKKQHRGEGLQLIIWLSCNEDAETNRTFFSWALY